MGFGANYPVIQGANVDDVVLDTTDQTIAGEKTFSEALRCTNGAGAVAGTGVAVEEFGDGVMRQTVITFTNAARALVDEAGVVAYLGSKFYDFPRGLLKIHSFVADLALTKSSAGVNDDWDGDFGVGSVTAGNNNALATTEQDFIPTTATPQAVAGATTAKGMSTSTEADQLIDATTATGAALAAFLNILVDDADHDVTGTPCNIIANGTIKFTWSNYGDIA